MREIELKAAVHDEREALRRLHDAGARLVFRGRTSDRRFDTVERTLLSQDKVLRVRATTAKGGVPGAGQLDLKGPTSYEGGYKHRDETSVAVADVRALHSLLTALGYEVIREIDRDVELYQLGVALVRFERYPRMDVLVEVEGPPDAIEEAIRVLAMPRQAFTAERLAAFIARYEARTGTRAAVSDRELAGEFRYAVDDA